MSNPEPGNPVHKLAVGVGALLALLLITCDRAEASDKPWVYEISFDFGIPSYLDRLLEPSCGQVVKTSEVYGYHLDPRPERTISCGNNQPMFQHFLGRRCWKPLPNFQMDCGWRHFSAPNDSHEITFDAFAVKGAFRWGKR